MIITQVWQVDINSGNYEVISEKSNETNSQFVFWKELYKFDGFSFESIKLSEFSGDREFIIDSKAKLIGNLHKVADLSKLMQVVKELFRWSNISTNEIERAICSERASRENDLYYEYLELA